MKIIEFTSQISKVMDSPKSKFHGEIIFSHPIDGVGSAYSASSDNIEDVKSFLHKAADGNKAGGHIRIMENQKSYPDFDWKVVDSYDYPIKRDIYQRLRIGKEIQSMRQNCALTQLELSEKANVTRANIAKIEAGRYSVGFDVLQRVASALDADVNIVQR